MHFSVGQFTEEYLQQAPIGIMKNEEGKVIAFLHFNAYLL